MPAADSNADAELAAQLASTLQSCFHLQVQAQQLRQEVQRLQPLQEPLPLLALKDLVLEDDDVSSTVAMDDAGAADAGAGAADAGAADVGALQPGGSGGSGGSGSLADHCSPAEVALMKDLLTLACDKLREHGFLSEIASLRSTEMAWRPFVLNCVLVLSTIC